MKLPFDNVDVPIALVTQIGGAVVASIGIIGTTIYGCVTNLAALSVDELAIQPLHVVLILFIMSLAAFIVLILRAVWGKGVATVDRFSQSNEKIAEQMKFMIAAIQDVSDVQNKRLAKLEDLSYDALMGAIRESSASKTSNIKPQRH